mmetsp:Transcript_18398/g.45164  ORF Transcript_18398/g.45164 Transcript_18398/m.45164 type:complete len:421 (+) Transcript_18398:1766-3028(+)
MVNLRLLPVDQITEDLLADAVDLAHLHHQPLGLILDNVPPRLPPCVDVPLNQPQHLSVLIAVGYAPVEPRLLLLHPRHHIVHHLLVDVLLDLGGDEALLGLRSARLRLHERLPAAPHVVVGRVELLAGRLVRVAALRRLAPQQRHRRVGVLRHQVLEVAHPHGLVLLHFREARVQRRDGLLVRGLVVLHVEGVLRVDGRGHEPLGLAEGLDAGHEVAVGGLHSRLHALNELQGLPNLALPVVRLELRVEGLHVGGVGRVDIVGEQGGLALPLLVLALDHLHEGRVDSDPHRLHDVLLRVGDLQHPQLRVRLLQVGQGPADACLPLCVLRRGRIAPCVLDQAGEVLVVDLARGLREGVRGGRPEGPLAVVGQALLVPRHLVLPLRELRPPLDRLHVLPIRLQEHLLGLLDGVHAVHLAPIK